MSSKTSKNVSGSADGITSPSTPLSSSVRRSDNSSQGASSLSILEKRAIRQDRRHHVDPAKTAQGLNLSVGAVRAEWALLDARATYTGKSAAKSSRSLTTDARQESDLQSTASSKPPTKRFRKLSIIDVGDAESETACEVASQNSEHVNHSTPQTAFSFCTPIDKLPKDRREIAERARFPTAQRSESLMAAHSKALAEAFGIEPTTPESQAIHDRKRWDCKTLRAIARLEREGWSEPVIAGRVGRTVNSVRSMKSSVQPDYHNLLRLFTYKEQCVIWKYKDSMVSAEIAAKLGICNSLIVAEYHRLCRNGGPERPEDAAEETWEESLLRIFPDSRCISQRTGSRSGSETSQPAERPRDRRAQLAERAAARRASRRSVSRYPTTPWHAPAESSQTHHSGARFSWGDSEDEADDQPKSQADASGKTKAKAKAESKTKAKNHQQQYVTSPTYGQSELGGPPTMSGAAFSWNEGTDSSDSDDVRIVAVRKVPKRSDAAK